jgi:putative flippase GtrA
MGTISKSARARQLLGEIVRFLAVGGLATAVSVVGFNVLVHGLLVGAAPMPDQPLPAYVLVNVVAGCVAYAGLRLWAFQHRDVTDPVGGLVRFFGLGAVTMAIPVLCLWVSRYVLGLSSPVADNLAANVIGLSLGAGARFWVFRRYVFDAVKAPA